MIKMKALRAFGTKKGPEGHVRRSREFTVVDERRAAELETLGHAHRIDIKAELGAPRNKMEPPLSNKAAEAGPLGFPGGTTGAEAPAPSSPPDRQPRARRSGRSRDEDLLS